MSILIEVYVLTKKRSSAIMRHISERTSNRSCQENCCLSTLLQQQPNSEKNQMLFTALLCTGKYVTRPGWGRGIISFLFTIRGAEDKLPFVNCNPLLITFGPQILTNALPSYRHLCALQISTTSEREIERIPFGKRNPHSMKGTP